MFVRQPCMLLVPYAYAPFEPSLDSLRVTGWERYAPMARASSAARETRGAGRASASPAASRVSTRARARGGFRTWARAWSYAG